VLLFLFLHICRPYVLQSRYTSHFLQNETLSEKEIKRLGFALSEVRYNELLPLLARLNELEEQQAEEEVSSSGGGEVACL